MEIPQISGVIGGIIVLVKPQILAWIIGIYLIIFGAFALLSALGIT